MLYLVGNPEDRFLASRLIFDGGMVCIFIDYFCLQMAITEALVIINGRENVKIGFKHVFSMNDS